MIHRYNEDIDTDLIYPGDEVYITYISKNTINKLYKKADELSSCELFLIGHGKFLFKCNKYKHRKKIIEEINGE